MSPNAWSHPVYRKRLRSYGLRFALTDAFGTRLEPEEIESNLREFGLEDFQIVLSDDGWTLHHPGLTAKCDAVSFSATWLREKLSPLLPVYLQAEMFPNENEFKSVFIDQRSHEFETIALAEVRQSEAFSNEIIEELLLRIFEKSAAFNKPQKCSLKIQDGNEWQHRLNSLQKVINEAFPKMGLNPKNVSLRIRMRNGRIETVENNHVNRAKKDKSVSFLLWEKPETEENGQATLVFAMSQSEAAITWLCKQFDEGLEEQAPKHPILLDGLQWEIARKPTIARIGGKSLAGAICLDASSCDACKLCERACPMQCLTIDDGKLEIDRERCLQCYDCIEVCPASAFRPIYNQASAMWSERVMERPGWLGRLAGLPGPAFPAPYPPSYLLPKTKSSRSVILGLAITTMQEHAAALIIDGEVVGAIEEERINRLRHYGWTPTGRDGVTLAVDPTICLEEALCRRSIRGLLSEHGLTLDDVDCFALNGIPAKYRRSYSLTDQHRPPQVLDSGRIVCIPHHLAHAASAFRMSGMEEAWVLTVDGRGDRETAALFHGERATLSRKADWLALTDRSIGSVYENATRLLGFGTHGQGSLMALAAFGSTTVDVSEFLRADDDGRLHVQESGLQKKFDNLKQEETQEINQEQMDLASSIQQALEDVVFSMLRENGVENGAKGLCLAGGVALNCRLNQRLLEEFSPVELYVQPAANDAGTALGAALEAWSRKTDEPENVCYGHSYWGPAFDEEEMNSVLARYGLDYRRSDRLEQECAELLEQGQVLCWFQGRMEFGPRALGARSILADPRKAELKDRVNRIKTRESWRPFGPSVLAGHENDWFEPGLDSNYMLFTLKVNEEKRDRIPAVMHIDGSTRPQVVHRETNERYFDLIDAFFARSGVPMVLNTSFNRRGEPIVCTPQDAVDCFLDTDADVLALGPFIATRAEAQHSATEKDDCGELETLRAYPTDRRLLLRVTTDCDNDCSFCTLRDLRGHRERSLLQVENSLQQGRQTGCGELVIMRGEATQNPNLISLVRMARNMGYRKVQLQTNGRRLAEPSYRLRLLDSGVDTFEIGLAAANEKLHDNLVGRAGAFRETALGIRALIRAGADVLITIPVLRKNRHELSHIVALVHKLGVSRVQFNFPRPVEIPRQVVTKPLSRLSVVSPFVREAVKLAQSLGLFVSTEAFPFCHLDESLHATPDATEDWRRYRVDDLHLLHDSLKEERKRARLQAEPCKECRLQEACPRTWAIYLELFGSGELIPFR